MKLVYFLKPIGMAGPVKIGCSSMPRSRLMALDLQSPFKLELVASAPGDNHDERRLHWRFRKDRSHGEWFLASPDLLNLIDHVRLTGSLPPLETVPSRQGCRPVRNGEWKRVKTALGRRLGNAEIRAWGWHGRKGQRPAAIDALREKCAGTNNPPLAGADLEAMEAYIAHLRTLPDGRSSEANAAAYEVVLAGIRERLARKAAA